MTAAYLWLTKPGIVIGNTVTATAGFLFASGRDINVWRLTATILAVALVIASGCVINNYIDRHIDAKMSRTRKRALVRGSIPAAHAILFAAVFGVGGFIILGTYTNMLAVIAGLIGYFFYLVPYSIGKRRSSLGTVVGSVAGATPILVGYLASAGRLDTGAILVFLILALWQMPHFYAIAIYRQRDYAAAGLPVLPLAKGTPLTKQYILLYIGLFVAAACALTTSGYAGLTYLAIVATFGLWWLWRAIQGLKATDDVAWAHNLFRFSLRVILVFSIAIATDAFLP